MESPNAADDQTGDYPMGHISMIGNVDANILRLGAPRIVPGMTLEIMANHTLPFWMTTEDLPAPTTVCR